MSAHLRYLALRFRLERVIAEPVPLQVLSERLLVELYRGLPHYVVVAIFSIEESGLRPLAVKGMELENAVTMGEGIAAVAAGGTAPVFVTDVARDARGRPARPEICAEIAVPVAVDDVPLLVVDVQTDQPNSLGPSDRQLLGWLAGALGARLSQSAGDVAGR